MRRGLIGNMMTARIVADFEQIETYPHSRVKKKLEDLNADPHIFLQKKEEELLRRK